MVSDGELMVSDGGEVLTVAALLPCGAAGVHIRLMVSRGVKPTPYQNPRITVGKPTIVILPEWKEAAAGESVCRRQEYPVSFCVLLVPVHCLLLYPSAFFCAALCLPRWCSSVCVAGGSNGASCPSNERSAVPRAVPGPKERAASGCSRSTSGGGRPHVQDPGWNSLSKLNCISACIQVTS